MSEKTDWIGGDVKPTLVGVYERNVYSDGPDVYSMWDGKQWLSFRGTPDEAATMFARSSYQRTAWRGLANKPDA